MTERHPFYDPESAFRALWNSNPPQRRLTEYLRNPGVRDTAAGATSTATIPMPIFAPPLTAIWESYAANTESKRLMISLAPTARSWDAKITAKIVPDEAPGKNKLSVLVEPLHPETPPPMHSRCTLVLIEPDAFTALLNDVPELNDSNLTLANKLVRMLDARLITKFRVGAFVAHLPATEGEFSDNRRTRFDVPLEDEPGCFNQEDLDRVHLIIIVESDTSHGETAS